MCNSFTVSLQHWEYHSIFQYRAARQTRQELFSVGFLFSPHLPPSYKLSFFLPSLIAFSPCSLYQNFLAFLISSLVIPRSFSLLTALYLNSTLTARAGLPCESVIFKSFNLFQASIKEQKERSSLDTLDSDPRHRSLCWGAGRR